MFRMTITPEITALQDTIGMVAQRITQ
jgi:hypothetical protein